MSLGSKLVLSVALVALMAVPASAQVFGIEMGTPIENLDVTGRFQATAYLFYVVPPKPNSKLTQYTVVASPEAGTCLIQGAASLESQEEAHALVAQFLPVLKERYGPYRTVAADDYSFDIPPRPLTRITLTINATNDVFLKYQFTNFDQCLEETKQLQAGVDATGL